MSTTVTMAEAQAHLPELVARLGSGDELIITQDQRPVAKLVREKPPARKPRKAGNCIGMIRIVADDMQRGIQGNDFDILPIETRHTSLLTSMPFHHHDPFDRLLAAQALAEKMPIVSADSPFDAYGVTRLW